VCVCVCACVFVYVGMCARACMCVCVGARSMFETHTFGLVLAERHNFAGSGLVCMYICT
jgi:hypothetical protein